MKHVFIQHKGNPRLLLIFGGWGMDEHLLPDLAPDDADVMVCYDYRTLDFDPLWVAGYEEVTLWAWSMGVWAASQTFGTPAASGANTASDGTPASPEANPANEAITNIPWGQKIAMNGTATPVDDERGIPHAIFQGTLNGLDPKSLNKFNRRMCGSREVFTLFLHRLPQRPVDELREELEVIGREVQRRPLGVFAWTKAIIGQGDLIFTPDAQVKAWTELGIPYEIWDAAHYDPRYFQPESYK